MTLQTARLMMTLINVCFADKPVSEDGEEAKQERGADTGQQRLKTGYQTTQGTICPSS